MSKFVWTNKGPLQVHVGTMVQKVALEIERDTKMRCPVDTGNLRRSYVTQTGGQGDEKWATIGTNANYAMFVEMGTSKQTAQPHLGPALEAARAKYGK